MDLRESGMTSPADVGRTQLCANESGTRGGSHRYFEKSDRLRGIESIRRFVEGSQLNPGKAVVLCSWTMLDHV